MANVFDNFVNAYDKTANTDDRIKRGKYADFADWLRLNNTVSNDEITREYGKLRNQNAAVTYPLQAASLQRADEIARIRQPGYIANDQAIVDAIGRDPALLRDAAFADVQTRAAVSKDNALRMGSAYEYNLANPGSTLGNARANNLYAQDQLERTILSQSDPAKVAQHFGGAPDEYVLGPQGWTRNGQPVPTAAQRFTLQSQRQIQDLVFGGRVAGAAGQPSTARPFSAAGPAPFESSLFRPMGPALSSTAVPAPFYGRFPENPNAVSDNPSVAPVNLGPAPTESIYTPAAPYQDGVGAIPAHGSRAVPSGPPTSAPFYAALTEKLNAGNKYQAKPEPTPSQDAVVAHQIDALMKQRSKLLTSPYDSTSSQGEQRSVRRAKIADIDAELQILMSRSR